MPSIYEIILLVMLSLQWVFVRTLAKDMDLIVKLLTVGYDDKNE